MPTTSRTNAAGKPVKNRILLAMPEPEYRVIRPYLQHIHLPAGQTLHEPSERLRFAYFLNSGLVSLLVGTEDGKTVEAGIVGNEGVCGIPAAVGLTRSLLREVAVVATDGFRAESGTILKILKSTTQLQMRLSRYAVVQGIQIAQTVACNRLHHIEQRLARWLLMAQDRVDSPVVEITHDFLATVLGTNRPTVSHAAAVLQRRKCITYGRGKIRIVNREALEASSCECYWVIQQFERDGRP